MRKSNFQIQIFIIIIIVQDKIEMGNTILPQVQSQFVSEKTQRASKASKEKQQQQYVYVSDVRQNIVGKPRIVKSNMNNIQLEQYIVSNMQSPIQFDSNVYKLRSSSYSKNIAVVFQHKIINQYQKLFMVRVQKMKFRLNQIDGISFMEALCVLQCSLNGFCELVSHSKTPFIINQKMIAINQLPQVRVWLNENYALNKIMPNIKIRNENIMIHQIFSAISERVALQQRQNFHDLRFKIAQCPKIGDAKNVVTLLLQNANRKIILQQLVERQTNKFRNSQTNNNLTPITSNITNNFQPGFNHPNSSTLHTMIPNNQNINPNLPSFQHPQKIPMSMNLPYNPSNNMFGNPVSSNLNQLNSNPQPLVQNRQQRQRIQIVSEQYIKDDEGLDRIRMVRQQRQQPNPNSKSFSYNPNTNHNLNGTVNQSLPIIYGKNNFNAKDLENNQNQQTNRYFPTETGQLVSANSNPNKSKLVYFNNVKMKSQQDNNNYTLSPRNASPIRPKVNVIQYKSQNKNALVNTNLVSKLATSQNKISQIEKKIFKLKEEFNKNNQANKEQKLNHPYVNVFKFDKNDKFTKNRSVTPPANILHHRNHPFRQQSAPINNFTQHFQNKQRPETVIGQTAAKWDKKLEQFMSKKNNQGYSNQFKGQNQILNRRSQAVDDKNNLRRSNIGQFNGKNQNTNRSILANENKKDVSFNFGEGNNKANGKIFSYSQVNVGGNGNLNQRPNGNLQNQINLAHNQAGLQPSHSSSPLPSQLQPQLKTQINFGGNTFVNGPSNYQNFPGLMQNKSMLVGRKNYI